MQRKCEACGETQDGKFGSGRFCDKSCIASYANSKRKKRRGRRRRKGPKKKPTAAQLKARAKRRAARYRKRKKRQTPKDANLVLIKQIYEHCPKGYEVDHIKPLSKGGLHHEDNLQYLPASINRKKGNKKKLYTEYAIRWQEKVENE